MISYLFAKHLNYTIDEKICYDEIIKNRVWITAKNQDDGNLQFVEDKENCQFYIARLIKFPKTLEQIQKYVPDLIVKNSYVTKCNPHYSMVPHIDPGRSTAIIFPLGANKGTISFYGFGKKLYTYDYRGPTLTRVNVNHSATNNSNEYRFSITVEVPGGYFSNFLRR